VEKARARSPEPGEKGCVCGQDIGHGTGLYDGEEPIVALQDHRIDEAAPRMPGEGPGDKDVGAAEDGQCLGEEDRGLQGPGVEDLP